MTLLPEAITFLPLARARKLASDLTAEDKDGDGWIYSAVPRRSNPDLAAVRVDADGAFLGYL